MPLCDMLRYEQTSFTLFYQEMSSSMPHIEVSLLQWIKKMAFNSTQMWSNGFNNIVCAWAIYSYFTHAAAVDNFMLLSPQLAQPANQCPLGDLSVRMSQNPLSINLARARIPASSRELHSKHFQFIVCRVFAPGGCHRQMLITMTCWPPVTSQCTDNELDHLCRVVVTGHFQTFIYPAKVYWTLALFLWQGRASHS